MSIGSISRHTVSTLVTAGAILGLVILAEKCSQSKIREHLANETHMPAENLAKIEGQVAKKALAKQSAEYQRLADSAITAYHLGIQNLKKAR